MSSKKLTVSHLSKIEKEVLLFLYPDGKPYQDVSYHIAKMSPETRIMKCWWHCLPRYRFPDGNAGTPSHRASLSRSIKRLKERGLLEPSGRAGFIELSRDGFQYVISTKMER